MRRYIRLFFIFLRSSFSATAAHALDFWSYLIGKFIRLVFFLGYILSIFLLVPVFAGYDAPSAMLIFVTYSLVDCIMQMFFFRGLYQLQELVRTGRFDAFLTYPLSPLFYAAFRSSDPMDAVTLIPVFGLLGWVLWMLAPVLTIMGVLTYFTLILNGVLLAFAICVILGSVAFFTVELENMWWLYRYSMQVGRYPVEVFRFPWRLVFTWIIPLGVMMTFPSRALLGILSWQFAVASFILTAVFLFCALSFWRFALRRYSSASS